MSPRKNLILGDQSSGRLHGLLLANHLSIYDTHTANRSRDPVSAGICGLMLSGRC